MVTDEERDYMYRVYAHDRSMRINLGIRRRLAPLLENDRRRLELLNGLLFSLPGTPVIYYGDEIGMGDNFYLGDRNGVRTPMQWNRDRNAGFSQANPQRLYLPIVIDPEYHYEALNVENQQNNSNSLLWWMKRLINQRKQWKAFGRGTLEFIYPENRRILAFIRCFENERILVVANLSRVAQGCHLPMQQYHGMVPMEMFGNTEFPVISEDPYFLSLAPHAFYWFALLPRRAELESLRSPEDSSSIPTFGIASWDAVLVNENRQDVERYLPYLVRERQWFQGKERHIASVTIHDVIPFPPAATWLLMLRFEYSAGDAELYSISLSLVEGARAQQVLHEVPQVVLCRVRTPEGREGILYGGSHSPPYREELLSMVSRRRRFAGQHGVLTGFHTTAFRKIWQHDPSLESTLCKVDQNGTSIKFGERFILKMFRRVEPGKHPEIEIGQALSGLKERPHTARFAGWLEYRGSDGEALAFGAVHAYIPHETSAYQFTLDNFHVFLETALATEHAQLATTPEKESDRGARNDSAVDAAKSVVSSYLNLIGLLGRRTAELHLALSRVEEPEFRSRAIYGVFIGWVCFTR